MMNEFESKNFINIKSLSNDESKVLEENENQSKINIINESSTKNEIKEIGDKIITNSLIDLKFKNSDNVQLAPIEPRKETQNKNVQRNQGIDLARIISMYFIINLHIIYHGGPLFQTKILSSENKLYLFFATLFNSGVNIFGMISGFVGFHSVKFANLLHIFIQTALYNFGIAYYFYKTKPDYNINLNNYIFPVFLSDYWYFTAYFIMYFFLPLINSGIKSMDKRKYGIFNLFVFLFFSCFYQIRHFSKKFKRDLFSFNNGFSYKWLLILYFFGGYLGRFYPNSHNHNKYLIFIFTGVIIYISTLCRTKIITHKIIKEKNSFGMKAEYTAPSCVINAICFIIIFSKLNIKSKVLQKIISFYSPLTYGVYLLHNHKIVRLNIILKDYKWLLQYKGYKLLLLEAIESLKIFLFCSFIDYMRFLLFKMLRIKQLCIFAFGLIEKISNKLLFIFEFIY